jgi:hypothetical protein
LCGPPEAGRTFFCRQTLLVKILYSAGSMGKLPKIVGVIALVMLWFSCPAKDVPVPVAQKGVIDLRKVNLFNNSVAVSGEWGLYWHRLLDPDSLGTAIPDYVPFRCSGTTFACTAKKCLLKGLPRIQLLFSSPTRDPASAWKSPTLIAPNDSL